MRAKNIGQAQAASAAPSAGHLVAASVQLLNELVHQLQARIGQDDEGVTAKLQRRISRLKERNRALEECVVFMASAVGMCPACFGKVAECPACHGQGQPGKLAISQTAFQEIVAPLLQQQAESIDHVVREPTVVGVERGKNGAAAPRTPSTP